MSDFEKSVLITGGTGKLGRVLVEAFGTRGWQVAFTSRSVDKVQALLSGINSCAKNQVIGLCQDLTEPDAASRLASALAEKGVSPTCLVNNARNLDYLKVGGDGTSARENWLGQYLLDVVVPHELTSNLLSTASCRLESVVNVGSMYGVVAANPSLYDDPPRQSAIQYGVAKAALVHLTKEMAVRFAARAVRVNAVSFGGVEGRVTPEFKARYGRLCPANRMLGDDEVAGPVVFLASEAASGMTGHNLVVDGGWSIW